MSGWWFGTFCIFPYIGNNDPNISELTFIFLQRGRSTINQKSRQLTWSSHWSPNRWHPSDPNVFSSSLADTGSENVTSGFWGYRNISSSNVNGNPVLHQLVGMTEVWAPAETAVEAQSHPDSCRARKHWRVRVPQGTKKGDPSNNWAIQRLLGGDWNHGILWLSIQLGMEYPSQLTHDFTGVGIPPTRKYSFLEWFRRLASSSQFGSLAQLRGMAQRSIDTSKRRCWSYLTIFDVCVWHLRCALIFFWGLWLPDCCFGTCFILPYIGNNHPNWRNHIFQRGRYTTNQLLSKWDVPIWLIATCHNYDQPIEAEVRWSAARIPMDTGYLV